MHEVFTIVNLVEKMRVVDAEDLVLEQSSVSLLVLFLDLLGVLLVLLLLAILVVLSLIFLLLR